MVDIHAQGDTTPVYPLRHAPITPPLWKIRISAFGRKLLSRGAGYRIRYLSEYRSLLAPGGRLAHPIGLLVVNRCVLRLITPPGWQERECVAGYGRKAQFLLASRRCAKTSRHMRNEHVRNRRQG